MIFTHQTMKIEKLIKACFIGSLAVMGFLGFGEEPPQKIVFPEGLLTMSLNDSLQFDADYKVVTYIKGNNNMHQLWVDWMGYIDEFPEVPFIFYFEASDTTKLFEEMEKNGFHHPFVLDPENLFFEENEFGKLDLKQYNFIPYIVEGNTVIGFAEVGMPPLFRKDIGNLLDKK